jgi:hypothetical protein
MLSARRRDLNVYQIFGNPVIFLFGLQQSDFATDGVEEAS